nr:MAG TPA: hypothetical protein [Bacteriophage sp.]
MDYIWITCGVCADSVGTIWNSGKWKSTRQIFYDMKIDEL